MNAERIVKIAAGYIGQREITGNRGWKDKGFEAKMKATGWLPGHAWCAYFTELVWIEAYKGTDHAKRFATLFAPSATATFGNFSGSQLYKTGTRPKPGALAVWRQGTGWKGHIGVVETIVDRDTFTCIEGNTNAAGGREGVAVARKRRKVVLNGRGPGLNLIGFVYPPE